MEKKMKGQPCQDCGAECKYTFAGEPVKVVAHCQQCDKYFDADDRIYQFVIDEGNKRLDHLYEPTTSPQPGERWTETKTGFTAEILAASDKWILVDVKGVPVAWMTRVFFEAWKPGEF